MDFELWMLNGECSMLDYISHRLDCKNKHKFKATILHKKVWILAEITPQSKAVIQHCRILCSTFSCCTRVATFVDQQTVSLALSLKQDTLPIKLTPPRQKKEI